CVQVRETGPGGACTVTDSAPRVSPSPASGSAIASCDAIGKRLAIALPNSPARDSSPARQKREAAPKATWYGRSPRSSATWSRPGRCSASWKPIRSGASRSIQPRTRSARSGPGPWSCQRFSVSTESAIARASAARDLGDEGERREGLLARESRELRAHQEVRHAEFLAVARDAVGDRRRLADDRPRVDRTLRGAPQ